MSIDYKLIADEDPGGDLETAFDTMSARMVLNVKQQATYTSYDVAQAIGFGPTVQFLNTLAAAADSQILEWFHKEGLDLAHIDVINALTSANPTNLALVLALKEETVPKYGIGFKLGHLQNARHYRIEGRI